MTQRILIMGLPGAGKTRLAHEVACCLVDLNKSVAWFNADAIREKYNDWDFSSEGRLRQAERMRKLADESNVEYAICDFVAPMEEMRNIYQAHWLVWVDTLTISRFSNTNAVFVPPAYYDLHVTEQDAPKWGELFIDLLLTGKSRDRRDV
jgi:adenylylsulfate kinase